MANKKILLVHRKAPYGSGLASEALDVALSAAAFGQQVHLAFVDDGVFQLVGHQQPVAIGQKGIAASLCDLADDDIENIWVENQSLAERGLTPEDLQIPVSLIERDELARLMAGMDVILGF
jgi:tRNA 2-thiouridine synthesizing protein C